MKQMKKWISALLVLAVLAAPAAALTEGVADVKKGDSGDAVLELQRMLCAAGYMLETYISGVYDDLTEVAVMAFQLDHGLPGTGAVDAPTLERLSAVANPTSTPSPTPEPTAEPIPEMTLVPAAEPKPESADAPAAYNLAGFSLPGGVTFGMTFDEVFNTVIENGFHDVSGSPAGSGASRDAQGNWVEHPAVVRATEAVAGIAGAEIAFYFDDDDRMNELYIQFPDTTDVEVIQPSGKSETEADPHRADFGTVQDVLDGKYLDASVPASEDDAPFIQEFQDAIMRSWTGNHPEVSMAESRVYCVPLEGAGRVCIQHIQPLAIYRKDLSGLSEDTRVKQVSYLYGHYLDYIWVKAE